MFINDSISCLVTEKQKTKRNINEEAIKKNSNKNCFTVDFFGNQLVNSCLYKLTSYCKLTVRHFVCEPQVLNKSDGFCLLCFLYLWDKWELKRAFSIWEFYLFLFYYYYFRFIVVVLVAVCVCVFKLYFSLNFSEQNIAQMQQFLRSYLCVLFN